MAEHTDRRRGASRPRRKRRIVDDPVLATAFERVVLSVSDQLYGLQGRKETTLQELADGSGVSDRGILDIFKTATDPKISTLVRLAHFHGCELVVRFQRLPVGTAVR